MEREGHLTRDDLQGANGDRTNAMMTGAGQNPWMILKKPRFLLAGLIAIARK
jgi:hypothetical protein